MVMPCQWLLTVVVVLSVIISSTNGRPLTEEHNRAKRSLFEQPWWRTKIFTETARSHSRTLSPSPYESKEAQLYNERVPFRATRPRHFRKYLTRLSNTAPHPRTHNGYVHRHLGPHHEQYLGRDLGYNDFPSITPGKVPNIEARGQLELRTNSDPNFAPHFEPNGEPRGGSEPGADFGAYEEPGLGTYSGYPPDIPGPLVTTHIDPPGMDIETPAESHIGPVGGTTVEPNLGQQFGLGRANHEVHIDPLVGLPIGVHIGDHPGPNLDTHIETLTPPYERHSGLDFGHHHGPVFVPSYEHHTGLDFGHHIGLDFGPHAGLDFGHHTGLDIGPHTGLDFGPHAGLDFGPHAGLDFGHHTGLDFGHHTGLDIGPHTGPNFGHHTGLNFGHHTGLNFGHHTGLDFGHHTGLNYGHHINLDHRPYHVVDLQTPHGPIAGPPYGHHRNLGPYHLRTPHEEVVGPYSETPIWINLGAHDGAGIGSLTGPLRGPHIGPNIGHLNGLGFEAPTMEPLFGPHIGSNLEENLDIDNRLNIGPNIGPYQIEQIGNTVGAPIEPRFEPHLGSPLGQDFRIHTGTYDRPYLEPNHRHMGHNYDHHQGIHIWPSTEGYEEQRIESHNGLPPNSGYLNHRLHAITPENPFSPENTVFSDYISGNAHNPQGTQASSQAGASAAPMMDSHSGRQVKKAAGKVAHVMVKQQVINPTATRTNGFGDIHLTHDENSNHYLVKHPKTRINPRLFQALLGEIAKTIRESRRRVKTASTVKPMPHNDQVNTKPEMSVHHL